MQIPVSKIIAAAKIFNKTKKNAGFPTFLYMGIFKKKHTRFFVIFQDFDGFPEFHLNEQCNY